MLRIRSRFGRAECYGHNSKEKRLYSKRGIGKCLLPSPSRDDLLCVEIDVMCDVPQVTFLKKIETAERKAGILEAQVSS